VGELRRLKIGGGGTTEAENRRWGNAVPPHSPLLWPLHIGISVIRISGFIRQFYVSQKSGYLKVKIRLLRLFAKMVCLWYCGGTPNYSKINSYASEEWIVTLISQTRSKESLLAYFLSTWITYVTLSRPIVHCFHFTGCQYRYTHLFIQTSNCTIKSTSLYELMTRDSARSNSPGNL